MRFLAPAASAALITTLVTAAALSANAAVPTFVPTAGARSAPAGSAPAGSAPAGSTQARSGEPTLPTAVTTTATPTLTGANTAAPSTTQIAPRGGFAWPLSPRPEVFRRFEQPRDRWGAGHRGVDLLAAVGQPVLSAGDGVVAFSGVIAGRGVITVGHTGGLRTTYEPVDERLASGTVIHRGTPIGVLSPTPGHCVPRTCLHWGAISGQTYRDPLSLLGFDRPILLPLG